MAVITNAAGTNTANVDSNGNILTVGPGDLSQVGYQGLASVVHDGVGGASKLVRSIGATHVGNLEISMDSLLWEDTFHHTQFNVSKYIGVEATMTKALAGGFLTFNNGNSLASLAVARVQSFKTFPVYGGLCTIGSFFGQFSLAPVANSIVEWGFGFAATTATPTDGVFFRLGGAGQFLGVVNYNGSETTVNLGADPSPNQGYYFKIVISQKMVEFWADDTLLGTIQRPVAASTIQMAAQLPILIRQYNSAATTQAQQFKLARIVIRQGDLNNVRPWEVVQTAMGNSSVNIPDGIASGQTANYVNSTIPTSATLSNTAAGYTTLGGQWQFAAVAGAETDYALFAYQVPAATVSAPGKTLVVRGVRIECYNMGAASATTPTVLQWAIGTGSTNVSLATADSTTAGTRAPRRIAIGVQSIPVGTAIGGSVVSIDRYFDAPLIVEAGSFFHIILKMPVGTATASQIIRGTAFVNGFFE